MCAMSKTTIVVRGARQHGKISSQAHLAGNTRDTYVHPHAASVVYQNRTISATFVRWHVCERMVSRLLLEVRATKRSTEGNPH
jgi:hypothetical protein